MSDDALRRTTRILAVLGIGVAGYLTYVHYAGLTPVCGISHGCETVQTSRYASLLHTPVALLGLITYTFVFATSFSRGERAMLSAFAMAVTAFAFSVYLTSRELFTIHAICSWCVSSAIIFTLLAIITTMRLMTRHPAVAVLPNHAG
jgi:uncharacterized membrane protein